ncbi:MAG: YciK family oxidoreductase [Gammaproteobacteria bacterium]
MNPEKMLDYAPRNTLLDERVILVTGASAGIGAALARRAASLGAKIVLLGRSVPRLEAVYDEIDNAGGPRPGIFVIDLLSAAAPQYEQLFDAVADAYGRLDGLVHCAGILGDRSPIEHYDVGVWQQVMQLNVTAPFILTRTMFPLLRRSGDASVIFTSSGVGRQGRAFWGAYAVSKFATEGMMEVLAAELSEDGPIRCNAVNPGPTRTAMRRAAYPGEDPDQLKTPEEVLGPYLYLLGPDGRGVNGFSFDAQ